MKTIVKEEATSNSHYHRLFAELHVAVHLKYKEFRRKKRKAKKARKQAAKKSEKKARGSRARARRAMTTPNVDLCSLPPEMLEEILDHLSLVDLATLRATCSSLRGACADTMRRRVKKIEKVLDEMEEEVHNCPPPRKPYMCLEWARKEFRALCALQMKCVILRVDIPGDFFPWLILHQIKGIIKLLARFPYSQSMIYKKLYELSKSADDYQQLVFDDIKNMRNSL